MKCLHCGYRFRVGTTCPSCGESKIGPEDAHVSQITCGKCGIRYDFGEYCPSCGNSNPVRDSELLARNFAKDNVDRMKPKSWVIVVSKIGIMYYSILSIKIVSELIEEKYSLVNIILVALFVARIFLFINLIQMKKWALRGLRILSTISMLSMALDPVLWFPIDPPPFYNSFLSPDLLRVLMADIPLSAFSPFE